jgi:tRNA threonylcarbamoyladenosine dehydratase
MASDPSTVRTAVAVAVGALVGGVAGFALAASRSGGRGGQGTTGGSAAAGGGGGGGGGPPPSPATLAPSVEQEQLIREHLARNVVFFGEEPMQRIRASFVVVIGLGGVGTCASLSVRARTAHAVGRCCTQEVMRR